MLLVADIGNTQTVIGIYGSVDDEELTAGWRIATDKTNATGDVRAKLFSLMQESLIATSEIDQAVIASVVPSLGDVWVELIESMFNVGAVRCDADVSMRAGLFETDYPVPAEIGADRVADAIAVRYLYGRSAFVVDFGTATNIEIIDDKGMFVGGIIAPGMMTGATAMFAHATKLAAPDLEGEITAVGYNTEQAIRSGIVLGEAVRADGLVMRAAEELSGRMAPLDECTVIAPGGLAGLIAEHSAVITDVRRDLTLVGLRLLAKEVLD